MFENFSNFRLGVNLFLTLGAFLFIAQGFYSFGAFHLIEFKGDQYKNKKKYFKSFMLYIIF